LQHTQESLCRAHIFAVAGIAGINHGLQDAFDYGVDGQFKIIVDRPNGRRASSGYSLDFQAKATTDWERKGGQIIYDLEAKTYDDMVTRDPSEVTLMLILLCLPADSAQWHQTTPDATVIRNCCYWHILPPGPPCGNTSSKRIFIPETQLLTPESLRGLLEGEKQRRLAQCL
jgi:hypothetical protein